MSKYYGYDQTTGANTFSFNGKVSSSSTATGSITCSSHQVTTLGVGSENHPVISTSNGTLGIDTGITAGNNLFQSLSTAPVIFNTNSSNCSVFTLNILLVEPGAAYSQVGAFSLVSYVNGGAQCISGYDNSPNVTITVPNTTTVNAAVPGGKTLVFTISANSNISVNLAAAPGSSTWLSIKYTALKQLGMLTPP